MVTRTSTHPDSVVRLSCGIGSALGTTAYVINRRGIERILNDDDRRGGYKRGVDGAIPDVMARLFPDTRYAANPAPFLRSPGTRSLVNPRLDELRTVLFRPAAVGTFQSVLVGTGLRTNDIMFGTIGALLTITVLSGWISVDAYNRIDGSII